MQIYCTLSNILLFNNCTRKKIKKHNNYKDGYNTCIDSNIILAFFLLRNIIIWYFKINNIVDNLDAQKEIMRKILNKL
jgi:hypothetical protein